ncbi:MAG TPA: hypothetical protein VII01_07635 [Solirubrobacteraceae bacterium]
MVDLDILVSELHQLAVTREWPSALSAEGLSGCKQLTALPRYGGGQTGLQRLFADLESAIAGIFDEDDHRVARAHFRLEYGDRQYLARHRALNADGSEETTKTRRRAVQSIEPRLAFELFQRGIEWEAPDEYLDYGFRALEHDWTVTIDPSDIRRETFRQIVHARCVRPGQRFYVFGANDDGAKLESVRVVSDDPDHTLVGRDGVVRLDRSVAASDDYLVVVYLGKDYTTDDPLTTGTERVTLAETPPSDSGLFITPVGSIMHVRLTLCAPRELVPRVTLVEHDLATPWTPAEPDVEQERTSDAPVVFAIDNPKVGYRYEIAWAY